MSFITDTDYTLVATQKALEAISQVSSSIRTMAENEAIEEVSSYLRARYDVDEIFEQTGTDRNPQVVMYCCDVALYHMSANLPQRIGAEIREERYLKAIEWLEKVAKGEVSPNLPKNEDSATSAAPFTIHSDAKLNNYW